MDENLCKKQSDIQEQIEELKKQLKKYPSISKKREILEKFFIHENIFNLEEISKLKEKDFSDYLTENVTKNQEKVKFYLYGLQVLQQEYQYSKFQQLIKEVEECDIDWRLRSNVLHFLIDKEIKTISEINFKIRQQYIKYLENTITKSKVREYTKILDKIKLSSIKKEEKISGKTKLVFKEEKIFLLYYPVYELAMSFYFIRNKEELVWDFSLPASLKLKQQVFHMLMYAVNEIQDSKDRRVRFLLPLKWLYFYCVEKDIEDIENLERYQIKEFYKLVSSKVVMVDNSMQIVDNTRKELFLSSKDINWAANIWYMERFHLAKERINLSNPVRRLSFLAVLDLSNRKTLQEYIKYLIILTDFSVKSIQIHMYYIVSLLKYLDKISYKLEEVTSIEIKQYIEEIEKTEILSNSFNRILMSTFQFFQFLKLKEKIKKIPFLFEYYLKSNIVRHNNKSVPQNTIRMILDNLYHLPLILRLMFLHLWCIGLRINEVCTLKGNAYEWREGAAWILVYQNKTRSEKKIPIPNILYKVMKVYIKENKIGPEEYLFKNTKGQAYCSGTFVKKMIKELNKYNIISTEYTFRSHDFRHTIATSLYLNGASLQAIRDYLGHDKEEMTMQYIDYLPERIKSANEEYFNKENTLVDYLKEQKEEENNGG